MIIELPHWCDCGFKILRTEIELDTATYVHLECDHCNEVLLHELLILETGGKLEPVMKWKNINILQSVIL